MNYTLDNRRFFQQYNGCVEYDVVVVGCGGTGGWVAESLCRVLPKEAHLVLVDYDRVEAPNLLRQNFTKSDLKQFKSECLAKRLAGKFDRAIGYSTLPFNFATRGVIIGCVDNGQARRDIASIINRSPGAWWVDAGNGENFGQVLIGNDRDPYWYKDTIFHKLPLPSIQRPDLLDVVKKEVLPCEQNIEQGPTINQTMAAIVVEVVRRLIAGTCPWIQLYLDMETGGLRPVYATPETVKAITKKEALKEEERRYA